MKRLVFAVLTLADDDTCEARIDIIKRYGWK